jgi:transcription initiation factor IIE alpha subunit
MIKPKEERRIIMTPEEALKEVKKLFEINRRHLSKKNVEAFETVIKEAEKQIIPLPLIAAEDENYFLCPQCGTRVEYYKVMGKDFNNCSNCGQRLEI